MRRSKGSGLTAASPVPLKGKRTGSLPHLDEWVPFSSDAAEGDEDGKVDITLLLVERCFCCFHSC